MPNKCIKIIRLSLIGTFKSGALASLLNAPYAKRYIQKRVTMKFHILLITLISTLFCSTLIAGEVSGDINKLFYIEKNNPSTYPRKHILGKFGEKIVSEYAIGIASNRKGTYKYLNFFTFPNNITNKPVQLNFTVDFYDLNGNKLGESNYKIQKPMKPTDPNLLPASSAGSNVKEKDFDKVKKYRIIFTEK